MIVRQWMVVPQGGTKEDLTMPPVLESLASDQVAVLKQGTTENATERQVTAQEGQAVLRAAAAAPDIPRAVSSTTGRETAAAVLEDSLQLL